MSNLAAIVETAPKLIPSAKPFLERAAAAETLAHGATGVRKANLLNAARGLRNVAVIRAAKEVKEVMARDRI